VARTEEYWLIRAVMAGGALARVFELSSRTFLQWSSAHWSSTFAQLRLRAWARTREHWLMPC